MADPIPEPEGFLRSGQRVAVLAPERGDPWQFLIGLPRALKHRLKPWRVRRERGEYDVDVRRPERLFPVCGAALAGIAQCVRARSHPLLELPREAVEGILRHAEHLEALERERDAHPGIAGGAGRVGSRGHHGARPPQQLPPGCAVVNAEHDIGCRIRSWPGAQHSALNIIQVEHDVPCVAHRSSPSTALPVSRGSALMPLVHVCAEAPLASTSESGMKRSKPTIATTITMTTTFGSLKLWLPTTSAAAILRCPVPNASTRLVSALGPPRNHPLPKPSARKRTPARMPRVPNTSSMC